MADAGGAVYDRGYRPYDGPRLGRHAAVRALYRATLRRALGLRRPWRQKVAPLGLLAVVTLPALVNVGIGYLLRGSSQRGFTFFTYREYVGVSSALLLFVALTAPDVVCPERRYRVLSLIFARPIDHRGYAIAKIGAITTCVFAFSLLPQLVLFVGQTAVSDGAWDYVVEHADVLWRSPLAVLALAVFYGVVGVAVASLFVRRAAAGASILGLALLTSALASTLAGGERDVVRDGGSWAGLANVLALPLHLRDIVFLGHVSPTGALGGVDGAGVAAVALYVAVVAVGIVVVVLRARRADT